MKQVVLLILAFVNLPMCCHSAVLFSDSFPYANGSLVAVSGGTWIHHNGSTTGEVDVVLGRVFLTQNETEDVSVILPGQPYTSATNALLYAAFTLSLTGTPSGAGGFFAHFKASGTSGTQAGKIFVTTNGAANGFFRVGVANSAGAANVLVANDLSYNTDYLVVVRYAPSNAVTTLWLNPASESDTSITASDSPTTISAVAFALRQSLSSGIGMGGLFLDNLVLGTQFSDVVTNAPAQSPSFTTQPQSQTVTEGNTVVFAAAASGNPAPSFQWQWYGTNLPGQTGTTLTLANVTTNQAGPYRVIATNSAGTTNSDTATLTVIAAPPAVAGFSLVTYNTHGNFVGDWTTNSAQVQAIGRQVQYLNPDIITFQEIPMTNSGWTHMGEFVAAFRPGYFLATNSGTDGFIRSAILSRYPITRSKSWLDGADLNPFGYTNANFTRDLFEAQITVPGFPQPLHVFTTHLKSGQGTDDSNRRTAEAGCISNYFAMGFLTTNSLHPYVLTGDMNEDINDPPSSNPQSIQKLTSAPTGLRLTTPVNPLTSSRFTFSIQSGLFIRYDYILPNTLLFSNIASSQVFRTDLLNSPPPPLLANDDVTASDHLPVLMVFNNPFVKPFKFLSVGRTNQTVTLRWESVPGQPYRVESSTNLTVWGLLANNVVATNSIVTYATNLSDPFRFFRIYRVP